MKRLGWLSLGLLLIASAPHAQMTMMGVEKSAGGPAYTGPGNVVSGASAWWGLRAYNAAYATGLNKIANICTPSDAVCADVNSDASGNFNLAGTGSLTCNNSGSICTIKTLYDQSGAGTCSGPCDVTQATIANRPTLVVPGAANGCPTTAKFCMLGVSSNASQRLLSGALGGAINQPLTISVVYNNPSTSGAEALFDNSGNSSTLIAGQGGASKLGVFFGVSAPTATVTDNQYNAVQVVAHDATSASNVFVNAGSNPITLSATTGIPAFQFVLFNNGAPNGPFGGYVQEIGLWPSDLVSSVSAMNTNQHTYWGF